MGRHLNECISADNLAVISLQVNVVSTGLLALLLLPTLSQASSKARQAFKPHLSIVASDAHVWAALKPMDNVIGHLKSQAGFVSTGDPASNYGVSKSKLWCLASQRYH